MADTETTNKDNDDPSVRLKKEDLMLFLALHMEESPKCEAPPDKMEQSVKYNKCGIVVTTGDKMKKIVTMDCSRNELHAVEVVMMNFPRSLKGGNVFLSRKPCYRCTQFLIQGEFSSVYYWPRDPERSCMTSDSSAFTDSKCVDQMFLRSKISSECLVPETDTVKGELIRFTRKAKCGCCHAKNNENDLSNDQMKNIMMADIPDRFEKLIKGALSCLDSLLPCSKGSFLPALEQEDIKLAIHALQLCYLLAARSDDSDHGIGTVIYNEMGYIIGCGYNGYVTGATYGNFSRDGRDPKAKETSLVHAEANALLLRSQKDLDKAVLYSSKIPCVSCQLLIEAKGITKVISIDEPNEEKRDTAYTLVLYKVGSSTPATSSSTPASSSSTPASSSSAPATSSSAPATSSSTPASSSSTPAISSSTPASSSSTADSSSSTPASSSSTPASSSNTPATSSSTPASSSSTADSSSSTPATSSSAPASSSSTPATSSSTPASSSSTPASSSSAPASSSSTESAYC